MYLGVITGLKTESGGLKVVTDRLPAEEIDMGNVFRNDHWSGDDRHWISVLI